MSSLTPLQTRQNDLLTVAEVAVLLRVSAPTVRRWVKEGRLEAIRPGGAYRIRRSAVEELLEVEGAA